MTPITQSFCLLSTFWTMQCDQLIVINESLCNAIAFGTIQCDHVITITQSFCLYSTMHTIMWNISNTSSSNASVEMQCVCMCFLYINGPTRQYAVIHKNIKNIPKYLKNNNLLSQLVPCKPGGQPHWANPSLFIKHVPFPQLYPSHGDSVIQQYGIRFKFEQNYSIDLWGLFFLFFVFYNFFQFFTIIIYIFFLFNFFCTFTSIKLNQIILFCFLI